MTFQDLGLAEPILRVVKAEGYDAPTPIQAQIIPNMLDGRDVVGVAQTGTGKTAAFTLPLLNRLIGAQRPAPKTCRALVIVPTRELAAQVEQSIRTYGRQTNVTTCVVVGGVKPSPQVRALARGNDIVIATPGRLEDHMRGRAVRLDAVETVVLDEADQMLDLGFAPAIKRILGALPDGRQTALLSATMPAPIRALAEQYLDDPVEVAVARESTPIERIAQRVIHLPKAAKRERLAELLADPAVTSAIVFTRTKRGADRVARHLKGANIDAAVIHGDRSQGQRNRALDAFKTGRSPVLVATDIAARGIDVTGVSHVIQHDLPEVAEAYVHRIGRTARAGRAGEAIAFCSADEVPLLRQVEKLTRQSVPVEPGSVSVEDLGPPSPKEKPQHRKGQRGGRPGGGGGGGRGRGQGQKAGGQKASAKKPGSQKRAQSGGKPGGGGGQRRARTGGGSGGRRGTTPAGASA